MVLRKSEWPELDDLVMCTVAKVFAQGAFAKLDEYEGKEGMIHISEVTSGWVRNIRNHVREGQKVICKVLDINKEKGHIDLSLRRVKGGQRRWKAQQWKRERKAENLLEQAAKQLGKDLEAAYEEVGRTLQEEFDDIYSAFEQAASKGAQALDGVKIDSKWIDVIVKLAKSNVEPPAVEVVGHVDLSCPVPNGVEVIKSALTAARDSNRDSEVGVDVRYIGSPRYLVKISASSYKVAEEVLRKTAEAAIEAVEKGGGKGEFHPKAGE
jgi:translation initiation factor 2 subunit 1